MFVMKQKHSTPPMLMPSTIIPSSCWFFKKPLRQKRRLFFFHKLLNFSAAPASNLPEFGLPDIGGDFIESHPFMNVLNVEVDAYPHFSDATKLNFLYSCMKGQANSALDGLSATNENNSVVKDIFKERFSNPKKIKIPIYEHSVI